MESIFRPGLMPGPGKRHVRGRRAALCVWVLLALTLALTLTVPTALAAPPPHPRTPSLDVSGLDRACGAAVDSKGDLYAASPGEGKIKVFSPSDHETPIVEIVNANEPCALAVDSHGDLLVLEEKGHKVIRYVPDAYPFVGTPSYSEEAIDSSGEARGIGVDTSALWTNANLAIGADDSLFVAKGNRVEARSNEAQQVKISGSGTYTLIYDGQETAPLAAGASHEEVQKALEALSTIGKGNVAVTTANFGAADHRVTFTHALGLTDVDRIEVATSGPSVQTALLNQGGLGTDEEQRVALENATGGSFTLAFEGQVTSPIEFESLKAPKIQEALEALPNIAPGDVAVRTESNSFARLFSITFRGAYVATDVPQIEAASSLAPNEVQKVTVKASEGTYKLKFKGAETGAIKFDAAAGEVQTALNALATIGGVGGSVSVTGGPGDATGANPYLVTFEGKLGGTNVEQMASNPTALNGGTASVTTIAQGASLRAETIVQGWSGRIGEGALTEATGIAAYTHFLGEAEKSDRYLFVADAASEEVKVFAASKLSGPSRLIDLKLRGQIDGSGEGFEFGASGAQLAVDPGNALEETTLKCLPAGEQACTAGHLLFYDATAEAVREYDAAGHLLDSFSAPSLADGEPSGLAIDRSGGAGDGTIYVGSGAAAGASLLAFGPRRAPSREPLPALSHTLAGAGAVATDSHGDLYVAAGSTVHVYGPDGVKITTFGLAKPTDEALAVDSTCGVYAQSPTAEKRVGYYTPSACPPKASTTYSGPTIVATKATLGFELRTFALDATNDRLYVTGESKTAELGSAKEGWPIISSCFACGLVNAPRSIAVGAGHELYAAVETVGRPGVLDPAGSEVRARVSGADSPLGTGLFNAALGADLANGHVMAFNSVRKTAEEYDASGAFVAAFGSFTPLVKPESIAVDNSCALHEPPLTGIACEEFDPANGTVYIAYDDTLLGSFDVTAFGPLEYPPPKEHKLTVERMGSGSGKVTSSPEGIDCGSTCSHEFDETKAVTLTAKADPGSKFEGWGKGECEAETVSPAEGTCELMVAEKDKVVVATFEKEKTPGVKLTVALEGTGSGTVTSSPGLISCNPFCEDEFKEGTKVTLTASPNPGSLFMAWKGCDAGSINGRQCTVSMSKAREVKATFIIAYELTLAKELGSGPGTLQVSGLSCSFGCAETTGLFKEGSALTVKATPAKHFHLASFSDACTGTGPCELAMGEDHEVKALFQEDPKFTLLLSKEGGGQGLIKSKPGGVSCAYTCTKAEASFFAGEVITLAWKLNKGTTKLTWSEGTGTCTGTTEAIEGTCTLSIEAATQLEAEFE